MNTIKAEDFSPGLFWDIDTSGLDPIQHRPYIVRRVMECGTWQDWLLLCRNYSQDGIIQTARNLRTLDRKSLAFLSVIGNIPKEAFRCYNDKPSTTKHWIY